MCLPPPPPPPPRRRGCVFAGSSAGPSSPCGRPAAPPRAWHPRALEVRVGGKEGVRASRGRRGARGGCGAGEVSAGGPEPGARAARRASTFSCSFWRGSSGRSSPAGKGPPASLPPSLPRDWLFRRSGCLFFEVSAAVCRVTQCRRAKVRGRGPRGAAPLALPRACVELPFPGGRGARAARRRLPLGAGWAGAETGLHSQHFAVEFR